MDRANFFSNWFEYFCVDLYRFRIAFGCSLLMKLSSWKMVENLEAWQVAVLHFVHSSSSIQSEDWQSLQFYETFVVHWEHFFKSLLFTFLFKQKIIVTIFFDNHFVKKNAITFFWHNTVHLSIRIADDPKITSKTPWRHSWASPFPQR